MATIIPFPAPATGDYGEALFLALMGAAGRGAAGMASFGEVIEFTNRRGAAPQDNLPEVVETTQTA